MAQEDVDKIHTDALEATVDSLHEVFAIECVLHIDERTGDAPVELRAQEVGVPRPSQLSEKRPQDTLRLAAGIILASVEEVHTRRVRRFQTLSGGIPVDLISEGGGCSERQDAHPQARPPETSILHLTIHVALLCSSCSSAVRARRPQTMSPGRA